MLLHVEDIVPGMRLESAIGLKAGSYLVTPKELPDGLDDKIIESIQRFSHQFSPLPHFIDAVEDERTVERIHQVLSADISRMAEAIRSGGELPNFLNDSEMVDKVNRVMDKVLANPEIVREVYRFKNAFREKADPRNAILDHTFRVTLLVTALGVQLRLSVISLINLAIAALMHDMGILVTRLYPNLQELDELHDSQVQEFVESHVRLSVEAFQSAQMTILPQTREEITRIIASHHRLDISEEKQRSTALLLYLAEIVDEMIAPLPHKLRYNFSPEQLRILSTRMAQRNGINRVILALVKLYRNDSVAWPAVVALAELFELSELTIENYEDKLKEILDVCPHGMQVPYPPLSGNRIPRMIYCKDQEQKFNCEHCGRTQVAIQTPSGKMVQYYKCGTQTNMLIELNQQGQLNNN